MANSMEVGIKARLAGTVEPLVVRQVEVARRVSMRAGRKAGNLVVGPSSNTKVSMEDGNSRKENMGAGRPRVKGSMARTLHHSSLWTWGFVATAEVALVGDTNASSARRTCISSAAHRHLQMHLQLQAQFAVFLRRLEIL